MPKKPQKVAGDPFRSAIVELFEHEFGPRNTEQPDSEWTKSFDLALGYLQERYKALPKPGETFRNVTNYMRVVLLDDKGLEVAPGELTAEGCSNAIHQARELIADVQDVLNGEDEEDESND